MLTKEQNAFRLGWNHWVRGGLRPERPGPRRDGYDAAVYDNDYGGGMRPTMMKAAVDDDDVVWEMEFFGNRVSKTGEASAKPLAAS